MRGLFVRYVAQARPLPADQKRTFCSCVPTATCLSPNCPASCPSRRTRGVKLFRYRVPGVVGDLPLRCLHEPFAQPCAPCHTRSLLASTKPLGSPARTVPPNFFV